MDALMMLRLYSFDMHKATNCLNLIIPQPESRL
jgi:hypothetical protein